MNNTYLALATVNLVLGGLVFLLGLVILRENPHQRLNRVVSLMLFFGGFGAILSALSLVTPGTTAGGTLAASAAAGSWRQNVAYLWEFFFPTLFLFASIFPEERAFTQRARLPFGLPAPGFTILVYAPHLFHFALTLAITIFRPDLKLTVGPEFKILEPFLGLIGILARLFLSVHQALFSLVDLGFGALAVALLLGSWRRADVPRIRQQLGAISIGLTGCLALYALATSIPTLIGRPLEPTLASALTTAALTVGSGSIAYSIVRFKFLDAKLLARRGILYAVASALLIGLYLLVISRVSRIATAAIGVDARVVEPVFLIMALTLFQPAIARMEEWLDSMLLRDPTDYRNVLRQLGRDLQTTIDLETLLSRSIRTLTETLLLRSSYVVVHTPAGPVAYAGSGQPLSADSCERLVDLLPRLSTRESSFRLTDPVDGLRRLDRELLVQQLGIELMVPLRWRGEALGILLLGEKLTATEYTSEDVSLLTSLATQMSVSLQNALLLRDRVAIARLEQELNLARQIQRSFLLSEFPVVPRCEVYAVNLPSKHVGGDYYDVVPTADGGHLLAIADVAGKGVPAALLSAMLQAALRTQARAVDSVTRILQNINTLVYRSTAVHQFATFFLAHIDRHGMRLTFCNAGHNWPVLIRANGERQYLERGGLLLGIRESVDFEEEGLTLGPGDRLVFYTDGISEATSPDGELYGDLRIADFIAALPQELCARDIADRILDTVHEHLAGAEPQDDVTLLVLRVLAPAAVEQEGTPLPEAVTVV